MEIWKKCEWVFFSEHSVLIAHVMKSAEQGIGSSVFSSTKTKTKTSSTKIN